MPKMKPQGTVKVTFEVDDRIITCTSPRIQIGKDSWNGWEDMVIHSPYDVKVTPKKEEAPVPPEDSKTTKPALSHEQEAGLRLIQITAQKIERQQLDTARSIERVIQQGEQAKAAADHDFNMAILEALHTGLSTTAIEDHLNDTGFGQLEERVDTVHSLDTDMLYAVAQ